MGLCNCEKIVTIRVEGDMGADPLWCDVCQYNLDLYEMEQLSETLKSELFVWVNNYGSWVDWETETLMEAGEAQEIAHNAEGKALTEKVAEELASQYKVVFASSKMY